MAEPGNDDWYCRQLGYHPDDDTHTPTPTNTATHTPIAPYDYNSCIASGDTEDECRLEFPGTAPTYTPVPPPNTPTNTPIRPVNTPTYTPIPPTNTPTYTPIPPTNTPIAPYDYDSCIASGDTEDECRLEFPGTAPTYTPVPPPNTPTNTPIRPVNTPTYTPIPPTNTPIAPYDYDSCIASGDTEDECRLDFPDTAPTYTPVPATPTYTPIPPNTPTFTPVPPNTPTFTPVPPNTPTNTPIPPNTPTFTPVPLNTPTPVPPNTPTHTPIPTPTHTPTPTYPDGLEKVGVPDMSVDGIYSIRANLSWAPVTGAVMYQVQYGEVGGSWRGPFEVESTSYSPSLLPDKFYSFQVAAKGDGETHSDEWSDWSSVRSAYSGPPPRPSNPSLVSRTGNSITMSFSIPTGVAEYQVTYQPLTPSRQPTWAWTQFNVESASSGTVLYTVPASLAAGTLHRFKIRYFGDGVKFANAITSSHPSTLSSDWSASSYGATKVPPPESLTASPVGWNGMNLTWPSSYYYDRYDIRYRRVGPGSPDWQYLFQDIHGSEFQTHAREELVCDTDYAFGIRGFGDGDTFVNEWSDYISDTAKTGGCSQYLRNVHFSPPIIGRRPSATVIHISGHLWESTYSNSGKTNTLYHHTNSMDLIGRNSFDLLGIEFQYSSATTNITPQTGGGRTITSWILGLGDATAYNWGGSNTTRMSFDGRITTNTSASWYVYLKENDRLGSAVSNTINQNLW